MNELEEILAIQNESTKQSVNAQQKLVQLQKDIRQGKATIDPVTDFCIVNYGMPTDEQKNAVHAIVNAVRRGEEYLVHTVVEGRVDDRETCHSPLKWAKAKVEYLRFGKARGKAKITYDGIIIPGKHVWSRREGKELFDIGLGTTQFSNWKSDNDALITPLEITSEELIWDMKRLKLNDLPEDKWNRNFKYEFEPLKAQSLVYTGKEIEKQFGKIGDYFRENTLYEKAKAALTRK